MPDDVEGPLGREAAEEIVRRVRPGASVTGVRLRTGGEMSTVAEVRCAGSGERLIVKVYAERWRWKQAKERHVYEVLRAHGVGPVPEVLHTDGTVTVMTCLEGRPLSEVVDGLADEDVRAVYREMGAFLAALHRVDQPAYGYLITEIVDPEPTNSAYVRRQFAEKLREFGELGGDPALRDAVRARFEADGDDLLPRCRRPVLCHNDLYEGNVLVVPGPDGWRVSGFIDVENAVAADPMTDLAKTEYYSVHDDERKRRALLQGYGPLPDRGAERIALYRLYHALELWDWFASIGTTGPLDGIAADIGALARA